MFFFFFAFSFYGQEELALSFGIEIHCFRNLTGKIVNELRLVAFCDLKETKQYTVPSKRIERVKPISLFKFCKSKHFGF